MALRKVDMPGGRHHCELPRSMDPWQHESLEIHRCDGCGRFWRLLIGVRYHDWERVGWWESRRLRRLLGREEAQR